MLFKTRKKRTIDMLEQKKKSLDTYATQFKAAVNVVTAIIDNLEQTSTNIDQAVLEINEYQKELSETASDLTAAKEKNDKVIKNFRALLAD